MPERAVFDSSRWLALPRRALRHSWGSGPRLRRELPLPRAGRARAGPAQSAQVLVRAPVAVAPRLRPTVSALGLVVNPPRWAIPSATGEDVGVACHPLLHRPR